MPFKYTGSIQKQPKGSKSREEINNNPYPYKSSHWEAACNILRYIKNPPGKGLWFKKNKHRNLVGFLDANYTGDKGHRKSTGYCIFVGSNLATWKSKKQTVVSRSSTEAKYRAIAHTTCELIW